jgi:hypothetical protein
MDKIIALKIEAEDFKIGIKGMVRKSSKVILSIHPAIAPLCNPRHC